MKRCPQCNRVETDETLKFCRADGAILINDSAPIPSEAGTAPLGLELVKSTQVFFRTTPMRTLIGALVQPPPSPRLQ
ncbi:MAG TPA: hypothetical protein VJU86_04250 [Pyrinomonadaceae bacterium]|nr:hypothetical protein [Pyrinomonadaceae bacterium]